jgi:hypothetical protein
MRKEYLKKLLCPTESYILLLYCIVFYYCISVYNTEGRPLKLSIINLIYESL